jgi:hypothetical protein
MVNLKLFLPPNGSIEPSKVITTYLVVVYHLLFIKCEEVVITIIGYVIRITIATTSKYL